MNSYTTSLFLKYFWNKLNLIWYFFDVSLTVHLGIFISVINQLDRWPSRALDSHP